jgi:hypothetical protein
LLFTVNDLKRRRFRSGETTSTNLDFRITVKSGIRLWPFSARIQPFYSRFMPYTAPETALGTIDLGYIYKRMKLLYINNEK